MTPSDFLCSICLPPFGAIEVRDTDQHELGLAGFMALLKKIGFPEFSL
ncbi:MAG: hypothetical protein J7J70_09670 [Deltaproteobacteria bacterium]|nr:hypothetical protein [Candidatus Tharpellaceae bacterium]